MEGDFTEDDYLNGKIISIHALRVEGDPIEAQEKSAAGEISIHALRVEGDRKAVEKRRERRIISIHALRVEGDTVNPFFVQRQRISIHALRVEGDHKAHGFAVA